MKRAFGIRIMKILNCLALMMVIQSANTVCAFYFHQPEFPEAAKKFKKFR